MTTRTFKVKVKWTNREWTVGALDDYIADWVKTGEGSFNPDDRPDIELVEVTYRGKPVEPK